MLPPLLEFPFCPFSWRCSNHSCFAGLLPFLEPFPYCTTYWFKTPPRHKGYFHIAPSYSWRRRNTSGWRLEQQKGCEWRYGGFCGRGDQSIRAIDQVRSCQGNSTTSRHPSRFLYRGLSRVIHTAHAIRAKGTAETICHKPHTATENGYGRS